MDTVGGAPEPRVFSIGGLAGMIGSSRRVLDGALAPFPGEGAGEASFAEPLPGGVLPGPDGAVLRLPTEAPAALGGCAIEPGAAVGWVCGALPAPFKDDRYLVEFTGRSEVRVLAYLDRFGRAFAADEPSEVPPARIPDLAFVRDDEVAPEADEAGWVVVADTGGEERRVASYRVSAGRYDLFGSWYDFGAAACGLAYPDALARAYLACVYRPSLTGIPVPSSGLGCIFELLGAANPVRGLRAVRLLVERAQRDPALRPPALASLLVTWLEDAGFTDRASRGWLYGADDEGPLRLIRTRRYANTFYLGEVDEGAGISERTIWAVESALNRFLLLSDALGAQAALADEAVCARWDEALRVGIASQVGGAAQPGGGEAVPAGEWDARVSVAEALEHLRLPYRFRAAFDLDVAAPGAAAFLVTAPDASLMPRRRYDEAAACWVELAPAERDQMARAYAAQLGIALASAAFAASGSIDEVMVTARPLAAGEGGAADDDGAAGDDVARYSWDEAAALVLADDGALASDAPDADLADGALFYQVTFDRARFVGRGVASAASDDPVAFLGSFGAVLGSSLGDAAVAGDLGPQPRDPFCLLEGRPARAVREDAPECVDAPLDEAWQQALGARSARDVRVVYDGGLRRAADELAEAVASAATVQEAIR